MPCGRGRGTHAAPALAAPTPLVPWRRNKQDGHLDIVDKIPELVKLHITRRQTDASWFGMEFEFPFYRNQSLECSNPDCRPAYICFWLARSLPLQYRESRSYRLVGNL